MSEPASKNYALITNEDLDASCPLLQGTLIPGTALLVLGGMPILSRFMATTTTQNLPAHTLIAGFSLAACALCGGLTGGGIAKFFKDRERIKAIQARQREIAQRLARGMYSPDSFDRADAIRLNDEAYQLTTRLGIQAPRLPQPARIPIAGIG